jgi:FkbM family methyltransferase
MSILSSMTESCLRLYSRIALTERGGYRLARAARAFRPRQNWNSTFRTPDRLTLDLDLSTYPDCCMAYGLYELDTARLIKKILRPGHHFIDIGANIGYFTLLAAQRVGPTGRIDAFEPQPDNRARLLRNIQQNNLTHRVTVHPQALSDHSGLATIYFPALSATANHGCSSLYPANAQSSHGTQVTTARLDQALKQAHPRLIKMDVEGAEPLVVSGMTDLLQCRNPPDIIAEYNPQQSKIAGFTPWEFIDRLLATQPQYRVYHIGWRLKPLNPRPETLQRFTQCNLFFTRG